jgi:lambda family phage tail tape measure protein
MADQKVQLIIEAVNKTQAAFDDLNRSIKGMDDATKTASGSGSALLAALKQDWMAVAVGAAAALYAVEQVVQSVSGITMAAARYETLGVVMRVVGNNAGYTGAQMESFAQGLQKTGISMTESRQSLTRMVQAQLDLNQSSKLARVAQDAAVIGNINSSEAFQRLVYGIQSAQTEMLRTIGINVNFETSYAKVAKETGRATTSFTEAEKADIRMNAAFEAGEKITGTYAAAMETAGKQVMSLPRHFENLKVLAGSVFTPALSEIIEGITGALVDLNGELSGGNKEAIQAWGVNFRIGIISVEAELMRMGMLLDKIGGTMTSAQMLLYGPGAALGVESSTKRFEAAASANMEYERRYLATDKALEALAKKQIGLEYSLTDAGKAAAKATEDALEKRRLAAGTSTGAAEDGAAAAKKAQKAWESWSDDARNLNAIIASAGLDDFDKKIIEIGKKYEGLREKIKALPTVKQPAELKRIGLAQDTEGNQAVADWYKKYLAEQAKASEDALKQEDATNKSIEKGAKETAEEVKKVNEERRAGQEVDIQARLTDIEVAEKYHEIDKATAIREQIVETERMIAAQKEYLRTIDPLKDPTAWRTQTEKVVEYQKALRDLQEQSKQTDIAGALDLSLKKVAADASDMSTQIDGVVRETFDGMTDALTDFVMTGKVSFADLANSIIRDMIRISIQQSVTGPLASGLGGLISSYFGGNATCNTTGVISFGEHAGGVPGAEPPTFYRIVPNIAFSSAPRFHSGFAADEYPAVLQKGEGVFTAGQMKALGLAATGKNSAPQEVKVNIVNQSGQEMKVSNSKATFDAQELIVTLWMDAANRNAYGLRTMLGG